MCRRTRLASSTTSKPATLAEPAVGRARVQSILMVVDFPAPLGPRKAKISPWATSKLTPFTAVRSPKDLVRPRTSTADAPDASADGRPPGGDVLVTSTLIISMLRPEDRV